MEAFCSSFNTLLRMDDGRCVRSFLLLLWGFEFVQFCTGVRFPIMGQNGRLLLQVTLMVVAERKYPQIRFWVVLSVDVWRYTPVDHDT